MCDDASVVRRNEAELESAQALLASYQALWDKNRILEDFYYSNEVRIDGWKDIAGLLLFENALEMESFCVGAGETLHF